MINIQVYNGNGELIALPCLETNRYTLIDIDGVDEPDSNFNEIDYAGIDGSFVNDITFDSRQILLKFQFKGYGDTVRNNRKFLSRSFPQKQNLTFVFIPHNGDTGLKIDGYVKNIEYKVTQQSQTATVNIFAPYPLFSDQKNNEISLSQITPLFEFPFAIDETGIEFSTYDPEKTTEINNNGDFETGFEAYCNFFQDATKLTLYNDDTKESMIFQGDFKKGDVLVVNTTETNRGVYLIRDGIETNGLNYFTTSLWLTLPQGVSHWGYATEGTTEADVEIIFTFSNLYGGI